jgi:diphthamide synthase (EF-2-diphthine--ammonia ligase)
VDVCGENGEFHTFTFDGPLFSNPILLRKVKLFIANMKKPTNSSTNTACDTDATDAYDYGFYYCDLLPL